MKYLASIICIIVAGQSYAANDGKITDMMFSSASSIWNQHDDLVQIKLEGGFSHTGCHSDFAGIRKVDSHVISAALAAYMTGRRVFVTLGTDDTYFDGTRCIIKDFRVYPD